MKYATARPLLARFGSGDRIKKKARDKRAFISFAEDSPAIQKQLMTKIIPDNNQANVARIGGFREQSDDDYGEIKVVVDNAPLVAPGTYRLAFVNRRTALIYGRAHKVALRFQIIDQGAFYGVQLDRWYNCKRLIGKPRKNGNFQVGRHSDFLREFLTLFPDAVKRLDRISFKPYRCNVITGRIETVTHNAKQQPLPELMQYSIIRELLETGA